MDMPLLRNIVGHVGGVAAAVGLPSQEELNRKWGNYLRFLFFKHHLYRCTGLRAADRYFYVAENKSIAYRDGPMPDQPAGRPLSVVWYEPAAHDDVALTQCELYDGEVVLHPCAGDLPELTLLEASIAEISLAAGYYPPVSADDTARAVELAHEAHFLDHGWCVFGHRPYPIGAGGACGKWSLIVQAGDPTDVEEYHFARTKITDMRKMALARKLQVRDGLPQDDLRLLVALKEPVLSAAVMRGPQVVGVLAAARAAAKAKAAAKAAAKAKAAPNNPYLLIINNNS